MAILRPSPYVKPGAGDYIKLRDDKGPLFEGLLDEPYKAIAIRDPSGPVYGFAVNFEGTVIETSWWNYLIELSDDWRKAEKVLSPKGTLFLIVPLQLLVGVSLVKFKK